MRLKRCPSCFKNYDVGLYEGVCPYCGMHRVEKSESDMFREQLPVDWAKRKKRMRIVFIIALVVVIALPFIGYPVMEAAIKYQVHRESPGYFEPTEWAVGETAAIGDAGLVIEEVVWNPETEAEYAEGHTVMQLKYVIAGAENLSGSTKIRLCVDGEYILPAFVDGCRRELDQPTGTIGFVVPVDAEEVTFVVSEYEIETLVNRYVLEVEVAS